MVRLTRPVLSPALQVFTFFANPYISSRYRLDSVMCLVDAQHISRLADERSPDALDEAVNQIAFADTILLNKVDLVTDEELEAARDIVRSVNMTAKIIECQLNAGVEGGEGNGAPAAAVRPKPTWEAIMDVNSFSIERALQVDPGFMSGGGVDEEGDDAAATPPPADPADAARDGQPGSGGEPSTRGKRVRAAGGSDEPPAKTVAGEAAAGADAPRARRRLHDLAGVSSVGISATGPLDQFRFNMFMKVGGGIGREERGRERKREVRPRAAPPPFLAAPAHPHPLPPLLSRLQDLLLEKGRDIMRCKGVLCVKGQEKVKFVFQGVHDTVCFGPSAVEWSEDAPVSQIVFIGRDLDRGMLADGLRSCVWTPLAAGWAEHRDAKSGRPYYVHAGSGDKQWVRPDAEEDGGDPGGDVLVTQAELAALTARGVAA